MSNEMNWTRKDLVMLDKVETRYNRVYLDNYKARGELPTDAARDQHLLECIEHLLSEYKVADVDAFAAKLGKGFDRVISRGYCN